MPGRSFFVVNTSNGARVGVRVGVLVGVGVIVGLGVIVAVGEGVTLGVSVIVAVLLAAAVKVAVGSGGTGWLQATNQTAITTK